MTSTQELTQLLVSAGVGATAATALIEAIRKLRGNKTKLEIMASLKETVDEMYETNLKLRKELILRDSKILELNMELQNVKGIK